MDNNSFSSITDSILVFCFFYETASSASLLYIQIYFILTSDLSVISCCLSILIFTELSYVIYVQKSWWDLLVITKNYSLVFFSIVFSQNYAIVYFREILQYFPTLDERKYQSWVLLLDLRIKKAA